MSYEQPSHSFPQGNCQHANDLSVSVKEQFYAYNNRDTSDNRSAQRHLGPSEIGTPCDRRLAMSLSGQPPVNPGGDGFAAWLGTQGHRGMADIYTWANGQSGRFAVETPLGFNSRLVPRGTGDLLDRVFAEGTFIDWKFMGTWSLRKLRTSGPSPTYRTQLHTYGLGAQTRGERVKHIALVGMPRQGTSLEDMYVWSEPFNPQIAIDALARVERIGQAVEAGTPMQSFAVGDDCNYCPFHLRGSKNLKDGCNGKA